MSRARSLFNLNLRSFVNPLAVEEKRFAIQGGLFLRSWSHETPIGLN